MNTIMTSLTSPDIRILHDSLGTILEMSGLTPLGQKLIAENRTGIDSAETIDEICIPGCWIEYIEN